MTLVIKCKFIFLFFLEELPNFKLISHFGTAKPFTLLLIFFIWEHKN